MRKWWLIIIMCFFLCEVNANRKALLVGISKYPQNSGWCEISSSNDLELLASILKGHASVTIISGERASKAGIIMALKKLGEVAQNGDTILIHLSGHGQQMWSDDRKENDMLDEAFVPYDAAKDSSATYSGQNHLKDDELGSYINAIRKSAGSNGLVIVSIDACHSGSIDRKSESDNTIIRGTYDIFGTKRPSADEARFKQPDDTTRIEKGILADVIYISACAQYDINREIVKQGRGYGALSYSLGQALVRPGLDDKSIFIDSVRAYMALNQPLQSPKIRASFEYGIVGEKKMPPVANSDEESPIEDSPSPFIVLILVVVISVIIGIVWIRMKRR